MYSIIFISTVSCLHYLLFALTFDITSGQSMSQEQLFEIVMSECQGHQTFSVVTDSWGVTFCPSPLGGQTPVIVSYTLQTRSQCGYYCVELTKNCTDYTWYDDILKCEMYSSTPPTMQLMQSIGHCWSYVVSFCILYAAYCLHHYKSLIKAYICDHYNHIISYIYTHTLL